MLVLSLFFIVFYKWWWSIHGGLSTKTELLQLHYVDYKIQKPLINTYLYIHVKSNQPPLTPIHQLTWIMFRQSSLLIHHSLSHYQTASAYTKHFCKKNTNFGHQDLTNRNKLSFLFCCMSKDKNYGQNWSFESLLSGVVRRNTLVTGRRNKYGLRKFENAEKFYLNSSGALIKV